VTGVPTRYTFELRIPRRSAVPMPPWLPTDPVTSIRVSSYTPVPVGAQEREDHRVSTLDLLKGAGPSASWSGPDIPRDKPPYKRLWADGTGRIWVMVSMPAVADTSVRPTAGRVWGRDKWVEPVVFDIFEPSGRYIGRVPMPTRTMPIEARGDTVWATTTDAHGVPAVRRFRIVW
jgi:hypothetical protein